MYRTTILLNENLRDRLKKQAQLMGKTMTELIEDFVRAGLNQLKTVKKKQKLRMPTASLGKEKIDISNREELWKVLEAE